MFDTIRNWFEVRAAMKDERRLRADQAILNSVIVVDRLKHVSEMLLAGQADYAAATMEEVLARYPEEAGELPQTASVLIDLKRFDEAEQMTLRGIDRNPDSREFALLFCDIAEQRDDIAERLRRWRAFRRRYPAYPLAFAKEAGALVSAGQMEAADQVLADGIRMAPDDLMLAIDYGRQADSQRDWPEAVRRWTVVRDRHEHPVGTIQRAAALVEQGLSQQAEVELEQARRRFPLETRITEDLAVLAERRGDIEAALNHWAGIRREFPHVTRSYTEAQRLLRQCGDSAAADALISDAAARTPGDLQLQCDNAAVAERAGDWAEAARRWTAVRNRFPAELTPYVQATAALRRAGEDAAAAQMLAAAATAFPDASALQQQLAQLAEANGDWQQAARSWQAVVAQQPESLAAHTALARALERGGAPAAAETALAAAIAALPHEPALYGDLAGIAARHGRAEVAASRWAAARHRFGLQSALARGEATWLREQGKLTEALALLGRASRQEPHDLDLLHDLGRLAADIGDWPEAEACWRAFLARRPHTGWALDALTQALRQQGRNVDADDVMMQAQAAQPQDFGIAATWARQAAEAKDWPEAASRWMMLQARFPTEADAWWHAGIALREAGEADAARAMWLAGAERFAANASFPHDLARLAEARLDPAEAEQNWRRYVTLAPDHWWGWLGIAGAAKAQGRTEEAEALLLKGHADFPAVHVFLHSYAEWARDRGDWTEAERRAALLAEQFESAWEGLWGQALAVLRQGRPDEARALLLRGAERHPTIGNYAHDLARLAEQRSDWPEAERWWRTFVRLHPPAWWAHVGLASALREQERVAEAEAVLLAAHEANPEQAGLLAEYGRLAARRGDWAEAERRFHRVVEMFPDAVEGPLGLAAAAREQGRGDQAEAILRRGHQQHPDAAVFPEHLAKLAEARADWPVAAAWWQAFLEREQRFWWAHHGLALSSLRAGLNSRADAAFVEARRQFPAEEAITTSFVGALIEMRRTTDAAALISQALDQTPPPSPDALLRYGRAAVACEDWDSAIRCAQHIRTGLPGRDAAGFESLLRARLAEVDPDRLAALDDASQASEAERAKSLLMKFESLGGDHPGCEIGLIQRRLGADPIGLLRWTTTPFDRLIAALEAGFAGVGSPEQTKVYLAGGEYRTQDTLFQMDMLTFVRSADCDEATMRQRSLKRISYLRGKLIDDLTEAGKIFVYRSLQDRYGLDSVAKLKAAMGGFGRNMLLYLRLADENNPVGSCRLLNWDLVIGYVHRFSAEPMAMLHPEGWQDVFQTAEAHWALMRQFADQPVASVRAQAGQLRERDRAEAARALLLQASHAAPDDLDLRRDLADLAAARGEWADAEACCRAVLAQHPQIVWAQLGLAQAVGGQGRAAEADSLLAAAAQADPQDFALASAWASRPADAADWSEAARRWSAVQARFPDPPDACWHAGSALRQAGHADQAHATLREGAAQFPDNGAFQHDLARLAEAVGDWPDAEQCWRGFIGIHPQMGWAHAGLAHALREQGRGADADAVLLAAHEADATAAPPGPALLPNGLLIAWRWFVDGATALRHAGQADAAYALLQEAVDRFPKEPRPLRELARAAERRLDWSAAERCWRSLIAMDHGAWEGRLGVASCLCQTGDVAQAMPILEGLAAARHRDPDCLAMIAMIAFAHAPVLTTDWLQAVARDLGEHVQTGQASAQAWLAYANIAKRHEQFELYRDRLDAGIKRFASSRGLRFALADARDLAPRENDVTPQAWLDHPDRAADAQLLHFFENLGGGGNRGGCEFGFHQREYGFEPMSLLRWASIKPDQLCRLLEQRFDRLGDPDCVELGTTDHYDWQAVELNYEIRMDHTHLDRKTVHQDHAKRLVCNLWKFLARKLTDDLTIGEKVFIYRMAGTGFDPVFITRVQQAIASYGTGRLMLVAEGTPANKPFELQRLSPLCLLVLREDLGVTAGNSDAARLASWRAICRAAAREFQLVA